jgi:hypothetical protein
MEQDSGLMEQHLFKDFIDYMIVRVVCLFVPLVPEYPCRILAPKFFFMDYIDKVYVALKDRVPGVYPIAGLREPEKFTSAVKFLIDGEWLHNVSFSNDYTSLIISEPFEFQKLNKQHKTNWYEK